MTFALLAAIVASSRAQSLTAQDVEVQMDEGTELVVSLSEGTTMSALQFNLTLPEGIIFDAGNVTLGTATDGHALRIEPLASGASLFVLYSLDQKAFSNGELLRIPLTAGTETLTSEGNLAKVRTATVDAVSHTCTDATFAVTVTRTLIDELATTLFRSHSCVDVLVKRSLNADEWSTIVLPFTMTAAQWKNLFGTDARLMEFTGYVAEKDGTGKVTGITINFDEVDATAPFEANHPYVIRVTSPIAEFTVDDVDVSTTTSPTVSAVTRTGEQWSELVGTYVADTYVPANALFLSGNEFWYSAGLTKMKGLRAYFDFSDVLADVAESSTKIRMNFNDEPTAIMDLKDFNDLNGEVFDLSGRRVTQPTKGMYIVNGNKVFVK